MNICLYSPYVPKHVGGGERYMFDVALALAEHHSVTFAIAANSFTSEASIRQQYEHFLGESLSKITFVPTPIGTAASFWQKLWWTKQWDVLYYLTDGSLFFSLARKNILHIQFPFHLNKRGLIEQLKLANWQVKNTNSTFTKNCIEPSWPVTVTLVHQPQIQQPVSAQKLAPVLAKKEKVVLHVGRFFKQLHSKRQDVLVDLFNQMRAENPKASAGWKLVLIGSVEDESYLAEVQKRVKKAPIEIYTSINRSELLMWYQRASIYWHATGFEVDEEKHPEKVEHFGISTGEAMSYGCAPVVINKGGQPEVLGPELAHLLWNTGKECIATTLELMQDSEYRKKIQQIAHQSIERFSPSVFRRKLDQMIAL